MAQWSYAVAAAALAVALGAIADNLGRRKPWLLIFTLLTLVSTAALWWVKPSPQSALLALALYAVAATSFGFAMIFYDAMLRSVAPPDYLGRLSGWGWSLGYAGGLICLVVALFGLLKAESAAVRTSNRARRTYSRNQPAHGGMVRTLLNSDLRIHTGPTRHRRLSQSGRADGNNWPLEQCAPDRAAARHRPVPDCLHALFERNRCGFPASQFFG